MRDPREEGGARNTEPEVREGHGEQTGQRWALWLKDTERCHTADRSTGGRRGDAGSRQAL